MLSLSLICRRGKFIIVSSEKLFEACNVQQLIHSNYTLHCKLFSKMCSTTTLLLSSTCNSISLYHPLHSYKAQPNEHLWTFSETWKASISKIGFIILYPPANHALLEYTAEYIRYEFQCHIIYISCSYAASLTLLLCWFIEHLSSDHLPKRARNKLKIPSNLCDKQWQGYINQWLIE